MSDSTLRLGCRRWLSLALVWALLQGCGGSHPGDRVIHADTPTNFALWRSKMSEELQPKQWQLFERAMQEIKYRIMSDGKASGSAGIDQAFRDQVDGMKLYDAMHLGLQTRLNRLLSEKAELEKEITVNARLKTRPDDEASADVLRDMRHAQASRLEKVTEEVQDAESDMNELEKIVSDS